MAFHVVERADRWWLRIDDSAAMIGPFTDRDEALTWVRTFTGQDDHEPHTTAREPKRKRLRGKAA